jgi:membrane-bound inhibitor of C-type lysozyme
MPVLAHAEMQAISVRFDCERGVELPVTFVNSGEESVAVMQIEGHQITLWQEVSASGARYGWPSDGSAYVLWTKGTEATVYWRDGAAKTETPILSGCVQAE